MKSSSYFQQSKKNTGPVRNSQTRQELFLVNGETPKISVVIPLYNKGDHIQATLTSVFKQTYHAHEVIVVDDGSTDNGIEKLREFPNVKLIQQENAGVSAARNRGIKMATGDIVAFLDADDQWLPHFLEEIAFLNRSYPQADVFATGYQLCVGSDEYRDPKIRDEKASLEHRLLDNYFSISAKGDLPFMMSSIAVRKKAFDSIGCFPVGEAMGEDQDFFSRAALRTRIAFSPRVHSIYHLDAVNRACHRNIPTQECPFSKRLRRWAQDCANIKLRDSIWDYCAAHVLHLASLNVRAGRFDSARQLLDRSIAKRNLLRWSWWSLRCRYEELKAAQMVF